MSKILKYRYKTTPGGCRRRVGLNPQWMWKESQRPKPLDDAVKWGVGRIADAAEYLEGVTKKADTKDILSFVSPDIKARFLAERDRLLLIMAEICFMEARRHTGKGIKRLADGGGGV